MTPAEHVKALEDRIEKLRVALNYTLDHLETEDGTEAFDVVRDALGDDDIASMLIQHERANGST